MAAGKWLGADRWCDVMVDASTEVDAVKSRGFVKVIDGRHRVTATASSALVQVAGIQLA